MKNQRRDDKSLGRFNEGILIDFKGISSRNGESLSNE